MPRYIVGRYHKIGDRVYQAGEILTIDDPNEAAWLSRDMQGHLTEIVQPPPPPEPEPIPEPVVEERAVEAPPVDRMVRKAKGKRKG